MHLCTNVCVGTQSCLTLCALWTVACQAPLSMEFSRQQYWNVLLFPPPGFLPDPGLELTSLVSPALADRFFTVTPPGNALICIVLLYEHVLYINVHKNTVRL